ncbi:MAG: hypothetical protein M3Z35_13670 [Nitrospirota bacterium]|nr:hypothetical protein [Nitrospirota bacterium]
MMGQMDAMSARLKQMQQHMAAMPAGTMGADHEAMSKGLEQMSAMTAPMKGVMEQMQAMAKDAPTSKDHAMTKDHAMMMSPTMSNGMNDMHVHMSAMSKDMGKMLDAMDVMIKHMDGAAPPMKKKP